MVIDDEFGLAEVLAAMLTDDGHGVSVALDGRRGLARLRESSFDLVLLDLMSEVPGSRPAIAPAGQYDGFVAKPFVFADLFGMAERLLRGGRC